MSSTRVSPGWRGEGGGCLPYPERQSTETCVTKEGNYVERRERGRGRTREKKKRRNSRKRESSRFRVSGLPREGRVGSTREVGVCFEDP